MPSGAMFLLASCSLPMLQPVVMVLHLMMLKAACALLEVLSISECYFQCLCFNTGLQVVRGRVILQYNQSLCVNITSKEVKGCVAEAEPSS